MHSESTDVSNIKKKIKNNYDHSQMEGFLAKQNILSEDSFKRVLF